MELIGGHVAVDFVNTLGGLPDRPDDEYLFDYPDLVDWLGRVGLLPPHRHSDIQRAADQAPGDADRTFDDVRRLRGALDHVLRSRLTGARADDEQLAEIQSAYAEAAGQARLAEHAGSYRFGWGAEAPRWPVWVIADASIDLLTVAPLHLLGRCAHCRWLFLDLSRNHSRRWCSMNSCGAIIKMRRHRAARGSSRQ